MSESVLKKRAVWLKPTAVLFPIKECIDKYWYVCCMCVAVIGVLEGAVGEEVCVCKCVYCSGSRYFSKAQRHQRPLSSVR